MESNIEFFIKKRNQAILLDDQEELLKICPILLELRKEDCLTDYYWQYAQKQSSFSFANQPNEDQAIEIFFHQLRRNPKPDFLWLKEWIMNHIKKDQDKYLNLLNQKPSIEKIDEMTKNLFEYIKVADEVKKDNRVFHAVLLIIVGVLIYGILALSIYFFIDPEALFFTNVFFLIIPSLLIAKGILKLTLKRDPFYYAILGALLLLIVFSYMTMFQKEPNILQHIRRIGLFLIEFWEYIARKLV